MSSEDSSDGNLRPGPIVGGPGSPRRRLVFFSLWAFVILAVVMGFRHVLMPFVLAVVVAYVFAPVVALLERVRIRGRLLPRWGAVLVVYVLLLAGLSAFTAVGVPRLFVEVRKLARDAPSAVQTVRDDWVPRLEEIVRDTMTPLEEEAGLPTEPEATSPTAPASEEPPRLRLVPVPVAGGARALEFQFPEDGLFIVQEGEGYRVGAVTEPESRRADIGSSLTDSLRSITENTGQHAAALFQTAQEVVRAFVRGVFSFFIMLMVSAYLLATSPRIFGFMRSLVRPRRRAFFDGLLQRIDHGLSGVVRGQLLIALVNGALSGIGFWFLDLNYWPILTLIATLLSIIPIFGAIISTVPAVLIALQVDMKTALIVLVWIIAIHQVEANILNPKIMGDAAKVHPVLVVFALLAGEHVSGITGALLAVPVLSIVQSLFLHFREVALGVPKTVGAVHSPSSIPPPIGD